MGITVNLTEEQEAIIEQVVNNTKPPPVYGNITLIEAGAGVGKTFLGTRIVRILKPKSGLYTCFNKAAILEGEKKFSGTRIQCKTFHALAYYYVDISMDIQSLSYRSITEKISYSEKRKIIDTIDLFFVSSSVCMFEYFEYVFKDHPKSSQMVDVASKYVQRMSEGKTNPTFNFLLKSLHLMLIEGTVVIDVDIVILDEINDVTAVNLEIFRLVKAPIKLGLGESHQAIYEFLNLVNGFDILKDEAVTMKLTQSFRCSTQIAKRIETKMKKVLDKDFKFTGTESPCRNGKTLFVTLTNAAIIGELSERLEEGKSFTLLRKPQDIFAAVLAVSSASQGKAPYQAKFAFLMDLYEEFHQQNVHKTYTAYLLMELDDPEINGAITLLSNLRSKSINIFNLYTEVKNAKPDPDYVVSTAYTSKGLEMETVYVCADLNNRFEKACNGELSDEEALTIKRVYYVACSRAGVNLENSIL